MRNSKFIKISLLILTLALSLGAVFAMSAVAAEEEQTTNQLKILSQNVSYTDKFALMYAVDASAVAPVDLYVYEEMPGEETQYSYKKTATAVTPGNVSGLGQDAYILTSEGVGATEMTKQFYVKAVDANGNESAIKRYSVTEYLYQRLSTPSASDAQKEFYTNTINFASNAQLVLAKEGTTPTLVSEYRYVTIDGGTVDGFNAGIFPVGSTVTPKVAGAIAATWNVTTQDKEGVVSTAEAQGSFVVADSNKNEVTVKSIVAYRDGIDDIESYTKVNTNKFWTFDNTDVGLGKSTIALASDPEHGQVVKTVLNTDGGGFRIEQNNTLPEGTAATAFEVSLDLKMTLPNLDPAANNRVELQLRTAGGSSIHRIEFIDASDHDVLGEIVDKDAFNIRSCSGVTKGNKIIYGSDLTDWNHVRIVMYKGDQNAYVYINGSDDPAVIQIYGNSYNMEDIGFLQIQTETNSSYSSAGVEILVDNVFCGFTTDTKPAN